MRPSRLNLMNATSSYGDKYDHAVEIPRQRDLEKVTVYTRVLPDDNVVYMACAAPGRRAAIVERACSRMVQSLHVTDAAVNRP